jgi:hypothetical protein
VNCGGLVSTPVPVFAVSFVLLWLQHSAAGLREGGVEWALYSGSSLLSVVRFAVGISFVRSFLWWFSGLFRRFVSLVCFAGLFRLPFGPARSCWATRGLMSKLLWWSWDGSFDGSKPVLLE